MPRSRPSVITAHAGLTVVFTVGLVSFAAAGTARANSADVRVDGSSFVFLDGLLVFGATDNLYFTTFDGSTGFPLGCCDEDLSGEFSPITPGATSYRSDYLVGDPEVFEYGTVSVTVAASDGDGDGMLDPLERVRAGNFTMSGTTTCHWSSDPPCFGTAIEVSVTRSAGSSTGSYQGTLSAGGSMGSFSGPFELDAGFEGTVAYTPGGGTLDWSLADDLGRTLSGQSGIVRNGTASITVPAFDLVRLPGSETIRTRQSVLQRNGSVFRGWVELVDGEPSTPFADYLDVRVEVDDPNDADLDGIPDILETPEPTAAAGGIAAVTALACLRRRFRRAGRSRARAVPAASAVLRKRRAPASEACRLASTRSMPRCELEEPQRP